jgi:CheY-like chemotaxis protein
MTITGHDTGHDTVLRRPSAPAGERGPAAVRGWDDPVELVRGQLAGLDAWQREAAARRPGERARLTREQRLDLSRRSAAERHEQQALQRRAGEQMTRCDQLLHVPLRTRAVLAHRSPWVRDKLEACLQARGVDVLASQDDGADAVAAVVLEQPDLVLLEDRLPTLTGLQVVHRVRRCAPRTAVGVQLLDAGAAAAMLEGGADAVFMRSVAADEMVDALLGLLASVRRRLMGVAG